MTENQLIVCRVWLTAFRLPPAISLSAVEHPTNATPNTPHNHRALLFFIVISITIHALIIPGCIGKIPHEHLPHATFVFFLCLERGFSWTGIYLETIELQLLLIGEPIISLTVLIQKVAFELHVSVEFSLVITV